MITIVLPISRTDYLRPVFKSLAELEKPKDTELLIITDGDNVLEQAIDRRLDSVSFARIQVINFGDTPAENIDSRRYRISAIHNKAKHFLSEDCTQVFSVEDDTTYPPDTLTKMIKTFESEEDCAFVEGVELGRWVTPYVGAWMTDGKDDPQMITSILPQDDDIEPIAAGGLYCALIDAELYRSHHFEPYDKEGKNGLSCDLNFGLWLTAQGYQCFIDWTIQCDHIGERGSRNLGNMTPVTVQFTKDVKGRWVGRTIA